MKKIKPLKPILAAIFCAALLGVGSYFLYSWGLQSNESVIAVADQIFGWKFPIAKLPETGPKGSLAYSDIRDPGGIPQGLPVRLKVPVIGVDSTIEDALITPDGRMDVPVGSKNVAWFSLGPHPGQVGSAVIGGHFGINNGVKFVFYDLDKLRVGDKIYVEDDKGDTLAFIVRKISLFGRDDDATTVFTSTDGLAHLNLITCEGIWNKVDDTYPDRRVVFTDAITSEGRAPESVAPSKISTIRPVVAFNRSLDLGAQGTDVTTLQNFLEQKGFLVIPRGVPKGYFGSLTRFAVFKYQVSVGLPQVGIFGPKTRVRLALELNSSPVLPDAGTDESLLSAISNEKDPAGSSVINSRATFQIFIRSVKSVFTTPIDTLVTSLLLVLIVFVAFRIVRRVR